MFLIAITKNDISANLKKYSVETVKKNSFLISIYSDNHLSKLIFQPLGFSIVESPLIPFNKTKDIIFLQIQYNEKNDLLSLFKSTLSGRPIYYHLNPKGNFYCSTHVNLLRECGVSIKENTVVLPEFFVYRYVIPPQTLYKDIYQVTTGSKICIKLINDKWKIVSEDHYNPIFSVKKQPEPLDIIAKNTINYLDESISKLDSLKSHLAVLFSGGLDSSILFRLSERKYNSISTYSTGYPFEDQTKNIERIYAKTAAEAFNIDHNYFSSNTKDYLYGLIECISVAEEPLHHLQSVMMYLLFKNGVTKEKNLVISGEGADGCFGTNLHYSIYISRKLSMLYKFPFFTKIAKFSPFGKMKLQSFISIHKKEGYPVSDVNNILWSFGAFGNMDWSSHHFNVDKDSIICRRYENVKKIENCSIYDLLSYLSLIGEGATTQSIWSKLGESQGKILYYPFTDIHLLNYISTIPWSSKIEKPKNILRQVAHQLNIPKFIINRQKSSFGIQNEIWAKKGGIFEPLIPLSLKVFEEKSIRQMQTTDFDNSMIFWNMLNYALWKRLCVDNEPLEILKEELNVTL